MMFSFCSFITLSAMALSPALASSRDFIAVVHYEKAAGTQCLEDSEQAPREPVSARLLVAGEEAIVVGGSGSNSTCAQQASCLLNPESSVCTALEKSPPIPVFWDIDAGGLLIECDDTDTSLGKEEVCNPKIGCEPSSVFPDCLFQAYTMTDIIETPEVIQRSNPKGVEPFSYLVLYSDAKCQDLEGFRSFTEGPQEVLLPDDSASCADSIFCLSNPTGAKCQAVAASNSQTIVTKVSEDGQKVFTCPDNDDTCNPVSYECAESFIPGCYQRWPSAEQFFSNPKEFIGKTEATSATSKPLLVTTLVLGTLSVLISV